jgi:uncharacterized repeat protein (TIGR04076 family)
MYAQAESVTAMAETEVSRMADVEGVGFRVMARILEVKGFCTAGHKAGDELEVSGFDSGGLCGFFYHDIFPYLVMLQFGGGFPREWGDPDVLELGCLDKTNNVILQLRRIRD